jgi:protein phosphatase
MGTTLTAVLSAGNRLGLLHIGDSRAYLLRGGELSQITHDHTLVQTLIDEGRISEEEASTHPQRSVITRVLDGRPGLEPDLSVREVRAGDRYLLCSDGLTGPVASLDTLRDALALPDVQEAVDRLVQLALRGGGPDNVTVIVAEVVDTDHVAPLSPVVGGAAAESPQVAPPGLSDSAAARARTAERRDIAPPAPAKDTDQPPPAPRARNTRRIGVLAVLTAVLLLVGAGIGWSYVRSQYYVGADDDHVAVFRGVTGSVAGVDLSSVDETSDLTTDQLGELDAARVRKGIVAKDRDDALQIVARLKTMAATCAAPSPTALPSPSAVPTPAAAVPPAPTPSAVLPAVPVGPTDCPPA